MTTRLQLGTATFEVREATLEATLADPHLARRNGIDPASLPLLWLLRVETVQRHVDGQLWAPALQVIDLTPKVARWTELCGWTATWARDTGDPPELEPQATLLLQLHEELRENLLRLGERRGARFALGWRAVAGLTGDPPFAGRVPVLVSGEVRFTGITVDTSERETDAEVRARLASRIVLDGLRALQREVKDHVYDDGMRMAQLRFLPS